MKQLTELKDRQKVLVAFTVRKELGKGSEYPIKFFGNAKEDYAFSLNKDLKLFHTETHPEEIYDFNEVMSACSEKPNSQFKTISKQEFIDKLAAIDNDFVCEKITLDEQFEAIYNLFKSYHPESFTPEIGKEYEFSHDKGANWIRGIFRYYNYDIKEKSYCCTTIRPIQQSEEEIKAIELLKNLGYEVNKK